jgi:COP9 signalosome complex subunit 4
LLHDTLNGANASLSHDLTLFIQSVVSESTGLIVSRQVLTEFVASLPSLQNAEQKRAVLQSVLAILQPRAVTFEEQITSLRLTLADLLEAEEDWAECAKTLMAIPLDSGHR